MAKEDIEHDQLTPEADWRTGGLLTEVLGALVALRLWKIPLVPTLVVLAAMVPAWLVISVPLGLGLQTLMGLGTFGLAMWLRRYEGHVISMALMVLSVITSFRYMYWRLTETMPYSEPTANWVDMVAGTGLIVAELYALIVLLLGFIQVLWPLHRKPVPLPADTSLWPTVDVYIPTYNEPMSVVRPTVLAAQDLDWPADKLNIYVLDDGCRDEFAEFCEAVGVTHLPRKESTHAKAGNINKALTMTSGDLITIFDCDHIPTRSFLQLSVGWFLKDPKMALVQLPHHFFSPDPFERNLGTFKTVPNEGELFYGLLQDGNDFWNATFFCGSCAVLRREPLLQVGGVAVETVTEDAHTALKMHRLGWRSAYINVAQAAGLATESLSGHVGQRIRWARGMAQIFRVDNPFLTKGLALGQRICYANAMLHFFYGLPRVIFLTAPLSYLFFEAHIIQASALIIAAYALPHLLCANLTNSRLQGPFRHSFWAEVYESVLATYIFMPTLLAIINPKLGSFNVTEKGGMVSETYFDSNIAKPYMVILLLNAVGLGFGVVRVFFWNTDEIDTVLLNMIWTIYNLIIVGAALSVAWEAKQVRKAIRVDTELPARVRVGGREYIGHTLDLSEGGTAIRIDGHLELDVGAPVEVKIDTGKKPVWFPSTTTRSTGDLLCAKFDPLDIDGERHMLYCIFGRADAWVSWAQNRDVDHPGHAFLEVLSFGYYGVFRVIEMYGGKLGRFVTRLFGRGGDGEKSTAGSGAASFVAASMLSAMLALSVTDATAQGADAPIVDEVSLEDLVQRQVNLSEDDNKRVMSLLELGGYQRAIRLRSVQGEVVVPLSVRDDEVITGARLRLRYAHSPSLLFDLSHINVFVNQELVETIPLSEATAGGGEAVFNIDPRLFLQYNEVMLQFIGHYTLECEEPTHSSLWASISNFSTLELDVQPLALDNELNLLPQPFFDRRDQRTLALPFVFANTPTLDELRAAGLIASWFGAQASYRGAKFPVYIGEFPDSHAVVVGSGGSRIGGMTVPNSAPSRVSMMTHPNNDAAKLLVVSGSDGAGIIKAAKALSLGSEALAGASTVIRELVEPEPRKPYDAPNFVPTDRKVELRELIPSRQLEVRGLYPDIIRVNFNLPPDLFGWRSDGVPLDIKYRYTPTVGSKSTLNVNINEEFVQAIPLALGGDQEDGQQRVQIPFLKSYDAVNREKIFLPLYKLSGNNQLQFHYYFERKREGACRNAVVDNLRGVIDEDTTLDFSKFPHYTKLPELALFANGMFPYSRMADLSDTAVVVPTVLDNNEISAFLTVMGQLGNATGYPGLRMELVQGNDTAAIGDRNVLVLGSADNQPLLSDPAWVERMPLAIVDGATRLKTIGPLGRLLDLWYGTGKVDALDHAGRVVLEAGKELGAIMSFESPLASEKTAVVLTAGDSERFGDVANALLDAGDRQFIRGDLVLLNGDEINHYRLNEQFTVGSLPLWTWLRYTMSQQPWWLLIVVLLVALIIAVAAYTVLRRMASARHAGKA